MKWSLICRITPRVNEGLLHSKSSFTRDKFLQIVTITPRLLALFGKNPESDNLFAGEFNFKTQEESVFFYLINLGERAFRKQDHFVAAVLLLRAVLLNFSQDVCKPCWDSLLKMGMYKACRDFVRFFPEVFPNAKEILDIISRIEKAGDIFQNCLNNGQIAEAGELARHLAQNVGDANTYRMMWEFASITGDEKTARESLETSIFLNPLQERVTAAGQKVFLEDEKKRILFETNVPFFSDFTDYLGILEAWKIRDLSLFRNTFWRLSPRLLYSNSSDGCGEFPEIPALICRGVIFDILVGVTIPLDLLVDLIKISEPVYSGLKENLQPNQKFMNLSQEVQAVFPTKKDGEKFLLANLEVLALILSLTSPEVIKKRYLSRLIDIECYGLAAAIRNKMDLISLCTKTLTTVYSDLQESIKYYNQAMTDIPLERRNEFALKKGYLWFLILWNVYGHQTAFLELYELMKNHFYEGIKRNLTEFVFFMHFPLSHVYLNLTQTQEEWKKFNDEVEVPLAEYIQKAVIPANGLQPVSRKVSVGVKPLKVGFVYDRIVPNSPFKVFYSLLKPLVQGNTEREFQFFVYDIEYMEKTFSDADLIKMITDLGLPYVSAHKLISDANAGLYYSRLNKCMALRKRIISDGIDVLVLCNSHEQYNFLFTTRTAPVQIFWSHGNRTYNIPGIDCRAIHVAGEFGQLELDGFSFSTFQIGNDKSFYTPHVPPEKIKEACDKFPQNSFILGTIGRLIKIENREYLEAVTEILKSNSQCIYLACGVGGTDKIKNWLNQFGVMNRVFFPGMVDPHPYGHIIGLYLNSFPFSSGEALSEYQAKGKPSISLVKKTMEECLIENPKANHCFQSALEASNLTAKEFSITEARSFTEYIDKANTLIQDDSLREKISLFFQYYLQFTIELSQSLTYPSFKKLIHSNISRHSL